MIPFQLFIYFIAGGNQYYGRGMNMNYGMNRGAMLYDPANPMATSGYYGGYGGGSYGGMGGYGGYGGYGMGGYNNGMYYNQGMHDPSRQSSLPNMGRSGSGVKVRSSLANQRAYSNDPYMFNDYTGSCKQLFFL